MLYIDQLANEAAGSQCRFTHCVHGASTQKSDALIVSESSTPTRHMYWVGEKVTHRMLIREENVLFKLVLMF